MEAMMTDLDVVFFDFGGVLHEEGFLRGLRAIAAANGLDEDAFFEAVREMIFATGYVYGRCGEDEFWTAVRKRFPDLQGDPKTWRGEILSRFTPRPWMYTLVRHVREAGARPAILSDQVNWLDELDAEYGVFEHFDMVFNSYYHGWTKSEPEFFHLAMEAMGATPERCLLIDDARVNIEVGMRVGVNCIYYTDKQSFLAEFGRWFPQAAQLTASAGE